MLRTQQTVLGDGRVITVGGSDGTNSIFGVEILAGEFVSVKNVAPVLTTLNVDSMIFEDDSATRTGTFHDPVFTGLANSTGHCGEAMQGQAITLSGTFTDVGTLDTHSAVIDWGDGNTSSASVVQGSGFGSLSGSHVYASGGVYQITVTLTDDDTGTHVQTTQAIISGVGAVDGS